MSWQKLYAPGLLIGLLATWPATAISQEDDDSVVLRTGLVMVRWEPGLIPLEGRVVRILIDEQLLDQVVQQVLPDRDDVNLSGSLGFVTNASARPGRELAELELQLPRSVDQQAGKRLWHTFREILEAKLQRLQERAVQSDLRRTLDTLNEEQQQVSERMEGAVAAHAEQIAARHRVSAAADARLDVESQLTEAELEVAILEAERRAVDEQLQRVREESRERLSDHPLLAELKEVEALREEQLAMAHKAFATGSVDAMQLAEIRAQVVQARVDLLRTTEEMKNKQAGALHNELTVRQTALVVELARLRKRAGVLHQRHQELEQSSQAQREIERQLMKSEIELEFFRERRAELLREVAVLQREIRAISPVQIEAWSQEEE